VKDVCTVFPLVRDITVVPVGGAQARIEVWPIDSVTERENLTVPLGDCGSGIGQVLAMLYVVINADGPRTILIDEPQSFLHPGAIRNLFEILKRERTIHHQFIMATHSPTVVTAAAPCRVLLLRQENGESKVETINANENASLRLFLSEVGARLSDVFGADRILWVEGKTEELCYPRIIRELLKTELLGTEIIGIRAVGDLEGGHKKLVLEIYRKLCQGKGLLPPALAFCFDQEKLTVGAREELTRESSGLIRFIPRRMHENYLLVPKAAAFVLNEADSGRDKPLSEREVRDWLRSNGSLPADNDSAAMAKWLESADGAKLLKDLFARLSDERVCYDKVRHGVKLTDWIIENEPSAFEELAAFLGSILSPGSVRPRDVRSPDGADTSLDR
jgi:hypothetical protein